jgi:hypothetical protein
MADDTPMHSGRGRSDEAAQACAPHCHKATPPPSPRSGPAATPPTAPRICDAPPPAAASSPTVSGHSASPDWPETSGRAVWARGAAAGGGGDATRTASRRKAEASEEAMQEEEEEEEEEEDNGVQVSAGDVIECEDMGNFYAAKVGYVYVMSAL